MQDVKRDRWWTLYGPGGERLGDVGLSEAVIRATLPHAVIDREVGAIRLPAPPGAAQAENDAEVSDDE